MIQRFLATRAAFRAALVLVAVACALGVIEAGGRAARAPGTGAPAFAAEVVHLIGANRYGRAWELLHPRHQLVAPRSEYVACERSTPVPGRIVSLRVLGSSDATFPVAGTGRPATGSAVRVRIVIAGVAMPHGVTVVDTVHLVRVDGRWRWILPAERFERYAHDRC